MGRVCCQTHSSKVSIKVMYFFQNDVEKNSAKQISCFFCNKCGKKIEYIIKKWITQHKYIVNKVLCEKFSVENIFLGMFFYVTTIVVLTFCTLQAKCILYQTSVLSLWEKFQKVAS